LDDDFLLTFTFAKRLAEFEKERIPTVNQFLRRTGIAGSFIFSEKRANASGKSFCTYYNQNIFNLVFQLSYIQLCGSGIVTTTEHLHIFKQNLKPYEISNKGVYGDPFSQLIN